MEDQDSIGKYKAHFFEEFRKCVQQLVRDEQIHFADALYRMSVYAYNDPEDPQIYEIREKELLARYRHKMRYFAMSGFSGFVTGDIDHLKQVCRTLEINIDELLPDFENGNLFAEITDFLDKLKTLLYIAEPQKTEALGLPSKEEVLKDNVPEHAAHNNFSRARQVLLFYFLFRVLDKERGKTDLADIARFIHGMMGWEYVNINNSQLYKLYKKAPYMKSDKKAQKADLEWVLEQFKIINLEPAMQLVEEEIKKLSPP